MRVTLMGRIKGAALKPDSTDGKPALDVRLELNTVTASEMHDLIQVWEQTGARVRVTMEPLQAQLFDDSRPAEVQSGPNGAVDGQATLVVDSGRGSAFEVTITPAVNELGDNGDQSPVDEPPAYSVPGLNIRRGFGAEVTD